jgi:RimJ/RimL family protein N-acetyltransferase
MILAGNRELVAAYLKERIRDMGEAPTKDFEAIGVVKGGRLIGGVVYTEYKEIAPGQHDIRMHCAGEPGWLTKATIRLFFSYPFLQLRCVRVTAVVSKANVRARDLDERLGFKLEGCIKDGFGTGRDGVIYGMTRRDCRWIEGI